MWLRANRISLNTKKTEIIIFHPKNKRISKHMNFRISGLKITTKKTVKYVRNNSTGKPFMGGTYNTTC